VHRGSQRLRQVDAAQDGEWPAPSSAGADPFQGDTLGRKDATRDPEDGHRPGSTAAQSVQGDDSRRERLAGAFLVRDRSEVSRRLESVREIFPIVTARAKDKAGSLSGGQQRLVEFARCLMLEPELVVLDEPSMGLDPKTLRSMFHTVKLMNEMGRTVLLVEQNARQALKMSHHGVVLENGQVRLSGTGKEVLNNPEIGALYLGGTFHSKPPAPEDTAMKETD